MALPAIPAIAALIGGGAVATTSYATGYYRSATKPVETIANTATSFSTIAKIGLAVIAGSAAYFFIRKARR